LTLSSMTGFARTEGQNDACSWSWEVKSVNAKGLDVRCRLGSGFDNLEKIVRERAAKSFKRGSFFINLTTTNVKSPGATQINHQVLDGIVNLIPDLESKFGKLEAPSVAELLALRGVLEPVDDGLSSEEKEALDKALLIDLDHTFTQLLDMRNAEGLKLSAVLTEQLDLITNIAEAAEKIAAVQPEAIRTRLQTQVEEILQSVPQLSEERIAQEVAILITKADIREELDRLKAHEQAARALFASQGAVGRKLDFLCQELNREANTLCSKSTEVELTNFGLDLKAVIEQFREQIQNIE
jgi:uncharacterized protein (TIGR00255 family)